MNLDAWALLIGIAAGVAAGALYFGGLYATTRRMATSRRPALLTVFSFVGRTLAIVASAVLVATILGAWSLLAFAVGLTVARIVLVTLVRRTLEASQGLVATGARAEGGRS